MGPSPYFQIGLPLLNLVQGLLLSAIYSVLYHGIPGKSAISKESIYGLLLWLAGPLQGILWGKRFEKQGLAV